MINEERMQILRMVQEGKLSPDEAARLLEAVEQQGPRPAGPKPTRVRVLIREGNRPRSFAMPISVVQWLASLPAIMNLEVTTEGRKFTGDDLQKALAIGTVGKIFEADEGPNHLEIWFEV